MRSPPMRGDLERNTTTKRAEKNMMTARIRALDKMLDRLTTMIVQDKQP